MSWITAHKTLLGVIILLAFVFSANALLFGSHAVEEARGTMTAASAVGHHHDDAGHEHGNGQDSSHCCDTHHSHDVTGSDAFELASWIQGTRLVAIDPTHHLLEVFHERFIPPQHQA
ncbi:MAG: hypothetical protein FDZ69_04795 [Deltaproteobacteria bacterium]|nr:MAG: hypothetical protein FDZ69_04795 [Deltaproteobacteria bacterium]